MIPKDGDDLSATDAQYVDKETEESVALILEPIRELVASEFAGLVKTQEGRDKMFSAGFSEICNAIDASARRHAEIYEKLLQKIANLERASEENQSALKVIRGIARGTMFLVLLIVSFLAISLWGKT